MKIFIATKGIYDGCTAYRLDPYAQLGYEVRSEVIKKIVQQIKGKSFVVDFDLAVMHSPMSIDEAFVFYHLKDSGVPVLLDYDDLIWNMPIHWVNQSMSYPAVRQHSINCLLNADYITVSTQHLADKVQKMFNINANIQVIENAVHPALIEAAAYNKPSDKVRVLWRGNDSKLGDLYQIKGMIKEHQQGEWIWMGSKPWFLHNHYGGSLSALNILTAVPFENYYRELIKASYNYGLIVLDKHICNDCKSNAAWMENTLAGAVSIVPNDSLVYAGLPALQYSRAADGDMMADVVLVHQHKGYGNYVWQQSKQLMIEQYNIEQKNKERCEAVVQAASNQRVPGGI